MFLKQESERTITIIFKNSVFCVQQWAKIKFIEAYFTIQNDYSWTTPSNFSALVVFLSTFLMVPKVPHFCLMLVRKRTKDNFRNDGFPLSKEQITSLGRISNWKKNLEGKLNLQKAYKGVGMWFLYLSHGWWLHFHKI